LKKDRVYLLHIRDAAALIAEYTRAGKEAFLSTLHWRDATIRQLEIIGEVTKSAVSRTA